MLMVFINTTMVITSYKYHIRYIFNLKEASRKISQVREASYSFLEPFLNFTGIRERDHRMRFIFSESIWTI
jgi:hypothetical protein